MMGSDEDPKDGGAVAGAVFGAVFIYIVRLSAPGKGGATLDRWIRAPANRSIGILRLLRVPSTLTYSREPTRSYKSIMMIEVEIDGVY